MLAYQFSERENLFICSAQYYCIQQEFISDIYREIYFQDSNRNSDIQKYYYIKTINIKSYYSALLYNKINLF